MPEAHHLHAHSEYYISDLTVAMSTKKVAGIDVLNTPLINAAIDFARQHLDDWAYNHVMRSWLFGQAIADKVPDLANRDKELHSVAAILHDMGWSDHKELISDDKVFEVDGANVARDFIEKQSTSDWDQHRKQLLWDAIALHSYPAVSLHKSPETKATTLGIITDFTGQAGSPGGALTEDEWKSIVEQYPRPGFKSAMLDKMCSFCKTKPQVTYDSFVGEIGDAMLDDYSREGKGITAMLMNFSDAD